MFVAKKKYKELEKQYNDLLDLHSMPTIEKIEAMRNNIIMKFGTPYESTIAWAQILLKTFLDCGAENYLELTFGSGTNQFLCTIVKASGKTPDTLRREAENKIEKLLDEVKESRDLCNLASSNDIRDYLSGIIEKYEGLK